MNDDLKRAKEELRAEGHSCVLRHGDAVFTSDARGIAPLMEWIGRGLALNGFSAADKIVGKATALLFVHMGITAVYASVMSEAALEALKRHNVEAVYGTLVSAIINREGTGQCPMELAVANIDEPKQAHEALSIRLAELRQGKKA